MTAHVAEASEGSGRVLLWLETGPRAGAGALNATVRLAAAYASEIETVGIDPLDGLVLDDLPTARIADPRRSAFAELPDGNGHALIVQSQHRRVVELADALQVPVSHAERTGDPIDILAAMCRAKGPWNIIALSRAPGLDLARLVADIFANVSGATGILTAGRSPMTWSGRIAVVAEDAERLPSMLRAAQRIAGPDGTTHLIVAAPTRQAYAELEGQARLLADSHPDLIFEDVDPTFGLDGALDDRLISARPSLVVARFGGTLLSDAAALSRALAVSRAPFLLVR